MPDLLLDSIPGKMGKFPLRQCDAQRAFSQNRREINNPVASGYLSVGTAFHEERGDMTVAMKRNQVAEFPQLCYSCGFWVSASSWLCPFPPTAACKGCKQQVTSNVHICSALLAVQQYRCLPTQLLARLGADDDLCQGGCSAASGVAGLEPPMMFNMLVLQHGWGSCRWLLVTPCLGSAPQNKQACLNRH